METLLIVGFGARRSAVRVWGLQRNCIDNCAYRHVVNQDIASTIRWKVWQDLVEGRPRTPDGVCRVKPAWSDSYWQDLLAWILAEVASFAEDDLSSAFLHQAGTEDTAVLGYGFDALRRILNNTAWKDDLADYPPFPVEFWSNAGLSGVPPSLLGLYGARPDVDHGPDVASDIEADTDGKYSRKRTRELAADNPRNAKRRLAKEAARKAREENEPIESETSAQSSSSSSMNANPQSSIASGSRQKRQSGPTKGSKRISMKF